MVTCDSCGAKNLNNSSTCSECGAETLSASRNISNQNENQKILEELKRISGKIESIELKNKDNFKASLQSIDIKFWSVVWLMVKWAIASIPATIIFTIIISVVLVIFNVITSGSLYYLLR